MAGRMDDDDLRCSISLDFAITAPAPGLAAGAESAQAEYLAPHPGGWTTITEDGALPA